MSRALRGSSTSSVKPKVRVAFYFEDSPKLIALAGKSTITAKEVNDVLNDMNDEDVEKWIAELIARGHGSPLEHSMYVLEIACSRVASHQLVRHRLASYTQLSQRFSDKYLRNVIYKAASSLGVRVPLKPSSRDDYRVYADVLHKYVSEERRFDELLEICGEAFVVPPLVVESRDVEFLVNLLNSVHQYYSLLSRGLSYEDARYAMPQCVKTRVLVTMNARELFEVFLPLRMCSRAQWEIRYIAWSAWIELVKIHPEIFSYAGPRCVLYDSRARRGLCSLVDYLEGKCEPSIDRCPELVDKEKIVSCIASSSRDPWTKEYLFSEIR